ncbi:MAG: hypothetical protein E6R03_17595 [Hyphomicrobiaceae bacterium]|nr:MAG: hypothetical protein E6R03_17595 [Hyphomicrobiaceae bacterium]
MAIAPMTRTILADTIQDVWQNELAVLIPKHRSPTFDMIFRNGDGSNYLNGSKFVMPIQHVASTGAGSDYATARANYTPGAFDQFEVTTAQKYMPFSVYHDAILAASGDTARIKDLVKFQMGASLHRLQRLFNKELFDDGSGVVGQIHSSTTVGSATLVLTNLADHLNFEKGDVLLASATRTGSPRAGSITVASVKRTEGTVSGTTVLTCTGNLTAGISAIATGDYLFHAGTIVGSGAGYTPAHGIFSWLPKADPSDTFCGVDRSIETQRRSGIRVSVVGHSVLSAISKMVARAQLYEIYDLSPYVLVSSPANAMAATNEIGARSEEMAGGPFTHYAGLTEVKTKTARLPLLGDPFCPNDVILMLRTDDWFFPRLGGASIPHVMNFDGLQMLRDTSGSAPYYTGDYVSHYNLACARIDRQLIATGFNAAPI